METVRLALPSVNRHRPPPRNTSLCLCPCGESVTKLRLSQISSPSILGPPVFSLGSCTHFLIGPASFICREILFTLQGPAPIITSSEKPPSTPHNRPCSLQSSSGLLFASRKEGTVASLVDWGGGSENESGLLCLQRPAPRLSHRKCPSVTGNKKAAGAA